jgi:hypothetical protein
MCANGRSAERASRATRPVNVKAARGRTPLRIRVRFEPGRASRDVMARGYEQAVPIVRAVAAADDAARDLVVVGARHRPSRKQGGAA